MASLPFSTFNATLGAPDDSTTPPDASDRDWSSIIGITTAITGNILIALALNVQRFAHIQLHEKRAQIKARVQLAQRRAKLQAARGAHGESHELALNYEDVPRIHVAPSSDSERINVSAVSTYGTVSPSRPTPGSPPPATSPRVSNDDDDSERDFLNDDDSLSGLSEKSLSLSYLRSPYWWLGQVLITLGEMGNFLAYGFAPASIVSPLGVVALVSNCVIAPILFQEKFRARDFWGVVIAVAGVVVVVLSSGGDESKLGPHDVWDAITALAFEVYLCVTVAMIATLMWASKRYGKRTILIDLGLVGLFGGYTALATKGVSSMLSSTLLGAFQTPVTYALLFVLIATAVMQIRYLNRALQRFDSTQVIPIQFVMFTLCVIVGSAILYRDFERTTAAQSLKFISGCLFTFFGVFLITSGRPKTPDEENQLSGDDEFDDTIGLASQESYPGQEPYSDVTPPGTPVSTVTTHRIIYLPHIRVDNVQSFSCPLERILSTKVDSPWIGPWFWKASISPVPQGGIPDDLQVAELKLVFKNGGHSHFDSWVQIVMKQHAAVMEMSRATNRPAESIPREDLPSYQPGPAEAPPAYRD